MATKKKSTSSKTPTKKVTAPKKAAKKAAPKKKVTTLGTIDHKVTNTALKLVDEAASLLRKGIHSGSKTSEKARQEAQHKAHQLLNKATLSLHDLLSGSATTLRRVINKLD